MDPSFYVNKILISQSLETVDDILQVCVGESGGLPQQLVLEAEGGGQGLEHWEDVCVGDVLDYVGAVQDTSRLQTKMYKNLICLLA